MTLKEHQATEREQMLLRLRTEEAEIRRRRARPRCAHQYWRVLNASEWSWESHAVCVLCGHVSGAMHGHPGLVEPEDVCERTIVVYDDATKRRLLGSWWTLPSAAADHDPLRPIDNYVYQPGDRCGRCGAPLTAGLCRSRCCRRSIFRMSLQNRVR